MVGTWSRAEGLPRPLKTCSEPLWAWPPHLSCPTCRWSWRGKVCPWGAVCTDLEKWAWHMVAVPCSGQRLGPSLCSLHLLLADSRLCLHVSVCWHSRPQALAYSHFCLQVLACFRFCPQVLAYSRFCLQVLAYSRFCLQVLACSRFCLQVLAFLLYAPPNLLPSSPTCRNPHHSVRGQRSW